MKTISSLLLFFLLVGSVSAVVCYRQPTLSPLQDSSGNSQQLYLTNQMNYSQEGYYTGRVDGYLNAKANQSLNLSNQTNGYSVSLWVKYNYSDLAEHKIFYAQGAEFRLQESGNADGKFFVWMVNNTTVGRNCGGTTQTLSDNQWHFIYAFYNLTDCGRSIDGGAIGSSTFQGLPGGTVGVNTSLFALPSGGQRFNGSIDDVRIWNRSLNTTEIALVYANQSVTSGLVARWEFQNQSTCYNDDGSQITNVGVPETGYVCTRIPTLTPLQDASGNGNNVSNNGSSFNDTYFTFNGTQYLVGKVGDFMPGNASFVISSWFRVNTSLSTGTRYIYGKYPGSSPDISLFLNLATNRISGAYRNGSGVTETFSSNATTLVTRDVWNHVLWVVDRETATSQIYLNGQLSSNGSVVDTGNFAHTTAAPHIGARRNVPADNQSWIGDVDDFRYWVNRTMTPTEVLTVYNNGSITSGLVASYPFQNTTTCKVYGT